MKRLNLRGPGAFSSGKNGEKDGVEWCILRYPNLIFAETVWIIKPVQLRTKHNFIFNHYKLFFILFHFLFRVSFKNLIKIRTDFYRGSCTGCLIGNYAPDLTLYYGAIQAPLFYFHDYKFSQLLADWYWWQLQQSIKQIIQNIKKWYYTAEI